MYASVKILGSCLRLVFLILFLYSSVALCCRVCLTTRFLPLVFCLLLPRMSLHVSEAHPCPPKPDPPTRGGSISTGSLTPIKSSPILNNGSPTILGKRTYEQHNGLDGEWARVDSSRHTVQYVCVCVWICIFVCVCVCPLDFTKCQWTPYVKAALHRFYT